LKLKIVSIALLIATGISADPAGVAPDAIVQQFVAASRDQGRAAKGATMDVEIEAKLPRLQKQGRLHALRKISSIGRITYEKLFFEGDNTVKNNVIARYLTAESQVQSNETASLALTPDNYKFHYKGHTAVDGRDTHLFQVTPRQKRVGLYKGEIWIDAQTYLRVQESGSFVKNPSLFLKKVAFVRKYEIRDGISVPRQIQSVVDTRLVGKAELNIAFTNFALDDQRRTSAGDGDGQ
jgi:hypothetical protein